MKLELSETLKLFMSTIPVLPIMSVFKQRGKLRRKKKRIRKRNGLAGWEGEREREGVRERGSERERERERERESRMLKVKPMVLAILKRADI